MPSEQFCLDFYLVLPSQVVKKRMSNLTDLVLSQHRKKVAVYLGRYFSLENYNPMKSAI